MRTPKQAVEEFAASDARQSAALLIPNSFADPLDAPGRSFLGGLPFLPPGLKWPTINEKGKRVGLIFLGQIDLSDVPAFDRRHALPEAGVLYFFYKDNWEMEGGDEGVMPCAVLYSETSSSDWPLRAQPERMVAVNDTVASPPIYLDAADYRNRGHFRFDLRFAPFRSAPEQLDASQVPLGRLSDQDSRALADLLSAHPSTGKLGAAYVDLVGVETAWGYACEHEGLELFQRLQRASLAKAVAPYAGSEKAHLPLYSPRELSPDVIFNWAVIGAFARGLLHPAPSYAQDMDPGPEDERLRDEATRWLSLTVDLPPLDTPSESSAEAFLEFLRWTSSCVQSRRISYDLTRRFSMLRNDVFRHAVNLASEAGALARAPVALRDELDRRPVIRNVADDMEIDMTMHHMLGHGSYDHTVVQPSERADKVLLLRLDCGDPMLRGSEGSYQFWIDPKKLKARDFSKVELTC